MIKNLVTALMLSVPLSACAGTYPDQRGADIIVEPDLVDRASDTEAIADLSAILDAQSEAWNRGDIPLFMTYYWNDSRLRFGSGGRVARGWQATLDRYLRTYPDRGAMGTLGFSDLDVQPLAEDAAIVHGRWKLDRAEDNPSGLFTLVFRKFGDQWLIVSDTTTSAK